jgi:uncharacterized protein (DUF2267 family)
MATGQVEMIGRNVELTNVWINEIAEAVGTEDRHEAYRILRAVLHAIRDRITLDESAQLAAQLPELVRGVFYEGWRPSAIPMRYDADAFLRRIADEALLAGPTEASYAVRAAADVLRRHVSLGEIEDVLANLPADIRELLAETV